MSRHGALVVVGSGSGVGSHVAASFAQNGFQRVVLMSRNTERLSSDAVIIRSVAPATRIDVIAVDLSQTYRVHLALEEVSRRLGETPLECIFFNAARSGPTKLLAWPMLEFEQDLQISVVSLYAVIQWGIPQLQKLAFKDSYKPTLLVTSGALCHNPLPGMFSLAACRAAQYNIVVSCAKEFGPLGIRCRLIHVKDHFGDQGPISDAPRVAEEAWELYNGEATDQVADVLDQSIDGNRDKQDVDLYQPLVSGLPDRSLF